MREDGRAAPVCRQGRRVLRRGRRVHGGRPGTRPHHRRAAVPHMGGSGHHHGYFWRWVLRTSRAAHRSPGREPETGDSEAVLQPCVRHPQRTKRVVGVLSNAAHHPRQRSGNDRASLLLLLAGAVHPHPYHEAEERGWKSDGLRISDLPLAATAVPAVPASVAAACPVSLVRDYLGDGLPQKGRLQKSRLRGLWRRLNHDAGRLLGGGLRARPL